MRYLHYLQFNAYSTKKKKYIYIYIIKPSTDIRTRVFIYIHMQINTPMLQSYLLHFH